MVTLIRSDLDFILAQIKIAEADAAGIPLLGGLIPNSELPWGLRRVDGSNNNLIEGNENYGAADQPFPRATTPVFLNDADGDTLPFGPGVVLTNTNYEVQAPNTSSNPRALQPGDVVDADPRIISNLIVDQTLNNSAAIMSALRLAGSEDLAGDTQTVVTAFAEYKAARSAAIASSNVSEFQTAVATAQVIATQQANEAAAADAAADTAEATAATAQSTLAQAINVQNAAFNNYFNVLSSGGSAAAIAGALNALNAAIGAVSVAATASTAASEIAIDLRATANTQQVEANNAAFDLATAQTNLTNAQNASTATSATLATEEAELRATLDGFGIQIEESASGNLAKATLLSLNVAADEGLSAPFNSWMTLFGQFFDHGLDLVAKGGFGTVYIPLQPDDPLYVEGGRSNFMALTRSTLTELSREAGEDGQLNTADDVVTFSPPTNLVTPFVDQNQTYTSNPSHQIFHREYEMRFDATLGHDVPVATGRLLNGAHGGIATWGEVKAQARDLLGIELDDQDVLNVPELLVDPYGNFIPGPNGFPQIVTAISEAGVPTTVGPTISITPEGDTVVTAVDATAALRTGHAFLDDIAHNANPAGKTADADIANPLGDPPTDAVGLVGDGRFVYDNELLDAHYITGDGRGNENIGLTAVHHVFHSEHNRMVDQIKGIIVNSGDLDFINEWLDVDLTALPTTPDEIAALVWDGERLFQAAKVPTEMQYQHLVFEEFARKVQPFVNVFNDYNAALDPAILAEFAHTVYRFGHSMLNETVDRYDADFNSIGANGVVGAEQIGLIEAFLNPIEFEASGFTADEAAGAIARGMTRQHGNEIDEFVTEALRNNLVGLPLDLAALNIARGRETGVPTLNEARAEFYAGTADSQLKPYTSWYDFALNIKNPVSVINFIAAYGTHESVTSETTVEGKRDAATALVLGIGTVVPEDRLDFLLAQGNYAGGSLGGLNDVDFWIGGLAEKKSVFGGMLGSTFNFVFETQLEALQNGDRFYYLSRLANLNLTAQLENNKFSELIHRNTDATHLPGDVFSLPNYYLEVDQSKQFNADLADPTADPTGGDPILTAIRPFVVRDVATNLLHFTGAEHVVLGGTDGNDILIGGLGDDTLWGDGGDDRLEGGEGNDFHFGGDGNDIITDLFGDDEIRSGAGDDVVNAGQGINLIITDTGNDFIFAGNDLDEILAGQGDDFLYGGLDQDLLIGGEGNDWLEGGGENNLLLGDNGDLIQGLPIKRSVDSRIEGHDVLVSSGGNEDFDAETGDDIMVGGLGTDRFFGAFGFDWATYKNDDFGIEADMNLRLFSPPSLPASPGAILDRYAQVEALAGSRHTDFLRGDDITDLAGAAGDAGAIVDGLDHALYDDNVSIVHGLAEFLGDNDPAVTNAINEEGEVRFSGGNILFGGSGSDILEGRGGNDLIDGDRWLDAQIRITHTDGSFEFINTMSEVQARLFSGELKVSQLEIWRSIKSNAGVDDVDVAEFSGARADYVVEGLDPEVAGDFANDLDGDGFISVTHVVRDADGVIVDGETGTDGVDRVKNVERLLFSDQTIKVVAHANAIASGTLAMASSSVDGSFSAGDVVTASLGTVADDDLISENIVYYWQVETVPGSGVFTNIQQIVADEFAPVTGTTYTLTNAEAGLAVRVLARFKDELGAVETVVSGVSDPVGNGPDGVPGGPTNGDDLLIGTAGPDILAGLGGNDTLIGLAGDDILDGGTGTDTAIFVGPVADFIFERTPTGTIEVINNITGEEDELIGIEFVNFVESVDAAGVTGPLLASFSFAEIVSFADGLALPPNDMATGGDDVLVDVANNQFDIDGLGGNDIIVGLDLADNLSGGAGDDTLQGGGQNDILNGGTGNDVIDGGAGGNDRAVFSGAVGNYTFAIADNGNLLVTETASGDEDELLNVESLLFTGSTLTLAEARTEAGAVQLAAGVTLFNGNGTDQAVFGNNVAETLNGAGGDDVLIGNGGADILNGGAGRDGLVGGGGNDTISGGGADDTIYWSAGDDRDTIDGGAGTDTLEINGEEGVAETFRIFTRDAAIAAGLNVEGLSNEIIVTRTVGAGAADNGDRIAMVDNIEEIVINARPVAADTTAIAGDTIEIIGDFTSTSLALNTIHAHGGRGNDTYNISGLTSQHRLVVDDDGGNNTLIGGRPQDVFHLLPGTTLSDYTVTQNGDGTTTYSLGSFKLTVDDDADPTIMGVDGGTGDDGDEDTSGSDGGDDDNDIEDDADSDEDGDSDDTTDNTTDDEDEDEDSDDDQDSDGQSGGGTGAGTGTGTGTGIGTGTGTGSGTGSGAGSGTATPLPFVVYLGTSQSDQSFGGSGDDKMSGSTGDDTLFGFAGDDTIAGGDDNDTLFGGDDDDILTGNAGNDHLDGGSGNDNLIGGTGDDLLFGGDGDDYLFGDQGNDQVYGGSGKDVVFVSTGDGVDYLDGGDDIDTLNLSGVAGGAIVDLGLTGFGTLIAAGQSDTIVDFENVIGTSGNDTIKASVSVNVLNGGGGSDTFVFDTAAAADGDTISGFATGDRIDLSSLYDSLGIIGGQFTDVGAGGDFSAAGQLRLSVTGNDTVIEGNTDNDIDTIEFTLKVAGFNKLTMNDIIS